VTATARTITPIRATARHKTSINGGSRARRLPDRNARAAGITVPPPGFSGIEAVIAALTDEVACRGTI